MKITQEVLEKIMDKLENNQPIEQVALEYTEKNVSIIRKMLYMMGGERGKAILIKEMENEIPIKDIIRMSETENKTLMEISEKLGIKRANLTDIIKRYEYLIGKKIITRKGKRKKLDVDDQKIIEEYRQGTTVVNISNKFKISATAIRARIDSYIEKHGDSIEKEHAQYAKNKKLEKYNIIKKYEKGYTFEQIANKIGGNITKDEVEEKICEYVLKNGDEIIVNHNKNKAKKEDEHKEIEIDIDTCIEKIENGVSLETIAKDNGILTGKLKAKLFDSGDERAIKILIKEIEKQCPEIQEIYERYNKNETIPQISEEFNILGYKVSKFINMYKVLINDKKGDTKRKRLDKEEEKLIVANYKFGLTYKEIASAYNISESTAYRAVTRYEIEQDMETVDQLEEERSINVEKRKNNNSINRENENIFSKNKEKEGEER